jgi:hypothetical protein
MATSRSPDDPARWTAGVSIFSGRPDPEWLVSDAAADSLIALWQSLAPYRGAVPSPPALGYRGCFLTDGRRAWRAFGGVVTLRADGTSETRADQDRAFEKRLLGSAPDGLLPVSALV